MKINTTKIIACVACLLLAAVAGRSQDGTRSIQAEDFINQRPAAAAAGGTGKPTVRPKAHDYRFARVYKPMARAKKPKKAPANTPVPRVVDLGITVWKMRPPHPNEAGFYMPVLDERKERKMWLAERVPEDMVFRAGDKVRFAVESSVPGFLYVFDRETYSDGRLGEPLLLFPERSGDDNSVRPGVLFDLPDQREDVPYFNITPRKDKYAGELLTIIVSPGPLSNFSADGTGKLRSVAYLANLEADAQVEIFSRSDADNRIFSNSEAEATCGAKSRERGLCGIASRQLTRDEPQPQSLYRVKTVAGQPAVAFVKLAAAP